MGSYLPFHIDHTPGCGVDTVNNMPGCNDGEEIHRPGQTIDFQGKTVKLPTVIFVGELGQFCQVTPKRDAVACMFLSTTS